MDQVDPHTVEQILGFPRTGSRKEMTREETITGEFFISTLFPIRFHTRLINYLKVSKNILLVSDTKDYIFLDLICELFYQLQKLSF